MKHRDAAPTEKAADLYTSGRYGALCPSWHQDDSGWKVDQLLLTVPPGFWRDIGRARLRVVDVGCGAGGVLGHLGLALAAMGTPIEGLGIDIAEDGLALARQAWPEHEFVQQAVHDLEPLHDIGLLIDVIEHVENPWQMIRHAGRCCRYLIFHVPLDDNFLTEIADLYARKADSMGHIQFYSRRKALWLLQACGLEVLSHRLTPAFSVESSIGLSGLHRSLSYPRRALAALSPAICARWLGGMSLMAVTRRRLDQDAD